MDAEFKIRQMDSNDLERVSEVHAEAFPRQGNSREWIECNFRAYPRMQLFVAEAESTIKGYIHWTQRSGFRPQVVLELEQIAVRPEFQGQGIGTRLIEESLPMLRQQLGERRATIKHIVVTTRADNAAQRLYLKTLGAEVEGIISDLYSADEVFMVARNV